MEAIHKVIFRLLANSDRVVRILIYVQHLLNTLGLCIALYWVPVYRLKLYSKLYAAKISSCSDRQQQNLLYVTYLFKLKQQFKLYKFTDLQIKRCLDAHLKCCRVVS